MGQALFDDLELQLRGDLLCPAARGVHQVHKAPNAILKITLAQLIKAGGMDSVTLHYRAHLSRGGAAQLLEQLYLVLKRVAVKVEEGLRALRDDPFVFTTSAAMVRHGREDLL